MSKQPHKHKALIKEWAEGAQIEWRKDDNSPWTTIGMPSWIETAQYRVAPDNQYPTSNLTDDKLCSVYYSGGTVIGPTEELMGWRRIADAAVRSLIDSGQLPTKEAYDQCNAQLAAAEKLLESLGYEYDGDGYWIAPTFPAAPAPSQPAAAIMRDALERLARLGNGLSYGNSDGNMIARWALEKAKEAEQSQPAGAAKGRDGEVNKRELAIARATISAILNSDTLLDTDDDLRAFIASVKETA